ncbi:hypothetical protein ABID70_000715 [Clavibacter michiganensis]
MSDAFSVMGPPPAGRARVEVEHVEPDGGSVLVAHLEDARVRVVGHDVVALGEGDAVQGGGRAEDAVVEDALRLEVGAHPLGVDVVAFAAHPLAVEGPVPGGELEGRLAALLLRAVDHALQLDGLGAGIAGRGRGEAAEHVGDGLGRAGRLVGGDRGGVAREAEEGGALGAEAGDLEHERAVVVVVPARPTGEGRLHDPLAQPPVRQLRQVGVPGGQHERDEVLPLQPAVGGGLRGGRDGAGAQAVELRHVVDHDGEVVGVLEQVRLEARRQDGQAAVEVAEQVLRGVVEAGARDRELGQVALDEVDGLGVEAGLVARVVDGADPGVERGVEADRVLVRGELGGDLRLELAREGGAVRGGEREEDVADAVEDPTGPLERDEGVLERRRLGGVGDGAHLGEMLGDAGLERGTEVLLPDPGEGGHAVGEGARFEEGIRGRRHVPSLGRAAT